MDGWRLLNVFGELLDSLVHGTLLLAAPSGKLRAAEEQEEDESQQGCEKDQQEPRGCLSGLAVGRYEKQPQDSKNIRKRSQQGNPIPFHIEVP